MRNKPLRLEYGALLVVLLAGCGSGTQADGLPGANPGADAGADVGAASLAPLTSSSSGGGSFATAEAGTPAASLADAAPGPDAGAGDATVVPVDASVSSGDAAMDASAALDASTPLDASGDDSSSVATGNGGDANGLGVDSRAAYCAGSGPPVSVGDNVSGVIQCTGALAEFSFAHALCTCNNASVQGVLATDAFNSSVAAYQPGQTGAAVGVNEDFITAGVPDIGGSLAVDGTDGLTLAGAAIVDGDLQVAGSLSLAGVSSVGRDLWVGGNITSAGIIDVARDLHQPAGSFSLGLVGVTGSTISTPFTLDEPCACQDGEILDVAGIVTQGQAQNDDASIGLLPGAFDAAVGVLDQDLPCGRFYLDQIGGIGDVTFHVNGRTALFVGGDIASAGILDFDVGPAGELDVFVAGNLVPTGVTSFGSVTRPAAVRIYVAGNSNVVLTGAGAFVGNIYAPRALVILTGFSDVYGSIFAGSFEAPGAVFIHYDSAILDAGNECPPPEADDAGAPPPADDAGAPPVSDDADAPPAVDAGSTPPAVDAGSPPPVDAGGSTPAVDASPPPPPPACKKCGSCNAGTACIKGTCGRCTADSDCCSPLVCNAGNVCGPLQEPQ